MKIAFTIATANYLAQAKTVGESLLAHNPDYKFVIALLDKVDDINKLVTLGAIECIEVSTMKISCLQEMVDRYNLFELSNAVKPYCAEYLLNHYPEAGLLMYVDSDMLVYGRFEEVEKLIESNSIIITPHMYSPPPLDGLRLDEPDFLNAGIYNGGFFVIKGDEVSRRFLSWWQQRMRTLCFVDFTKGLFVDQIWLNFVPVYFKPVKVIEKSGYNAAYWNLHERKFYLAQGGKYFCAENDPLVFFHFSGFEIMNPESISRFQTRFQFADRPELTTLFMQYRDAVMANGYVRLSAVQPYYRKTVVEEPKKSILERGIGFVKRKLISSKR